MVIMTTKKLPERREHDLYPTPFEVCRAGIRLLPEYLHPSFVLDPGAGEGVWGRALKTRWSGAKVDGVEIREIPKPDGYKGWIVWDYLTADCEKNKYDLVMGNPPYCLAEEFIRKGMSELREGGWLIFLLRLAFLEGQGRGEGLFRELTPKLVAVSSRRISFSGDKKSNETAYAMYYWKKGYLAATELTWLNWDYEQ